MNPGQVRVVLVSPRNPLNIGAAARAMSNFGFTDLMLVNPYDLAFKEARSAVRAGYILQQARVVSQLAEALDDCALVVGTTAVGNRDLHVPVYRLEAAADIMREAALHSRVALLFGSEKFGLSNEDMSHCHSLLRIPTREEHGSMNLGQAVSICLYELTRSEAAKEARFAPPARIDGAALERLTGLMVDVLKDAGYINERTEESSILKIRRLLTRSEIPASDAETWQGMFRQIKWRIRAN